MPADPACSDPTCSYRAEAHRIPELLQQRDELREALREIDTSAHSFVLNDKDAQARIQHIADTARQALDPAPKEEPDG